MRNSDKKIFYWGSKPLGLKCFTYLMHFISKGSINAQIIGVCISDKDIKKDGIRGQNIKKLANKYKIPVFTEYDSIKLKGDLGICIGYPHKIPASTINNYKEGIINLHFAPLPYYRGSKTLTHAILNDEKKYGLTFHYIDETLDTGPIITIKWFDIPSNKSAMTITKKLEDIAFTFFKEHIGQLVKGNLPKISQEEVIRKKHIRPRFYKRDSLDGYYHIQMNWSLEKIYKIARAITLDSKKLPYFEERGKRVHLEFDENDFESRERFREKINKYIKQCHR